MTSTDQQSRPMNRESITTVPQAFRVLGINGGVSTQSEINDVFRAKVKAAHQHGIYAGDMDALTQAKDVLTEALKKAIEQAQRDQARTRAQQQEQEERERAKANQQKREEANQQKEEPTTSETPTVSGPLRLGPAVTGQSWEAVRTYERRKAREREQMRRLWFYEESLEQRRIRHQRQPHQNKRGEEMAAMQPDSSSQKVITPPTHDTLQEALQLFQQRQSELEQTRNQEDELQQALSHIQQQRAGLEQTIQTATALADQLRALLTQSEDRATE